MTSDNHSRHRELQQDARAWADFTGTSYTAALRQVKSPLAQGLLGDRVSARHLIATLDEHELIGARGGAPRLGENGTFSTIPWRFNGRSDLIELALITDMLRMFAPIPDSATPEVSSYSLKHTAEEFLSPHCSYVSNGRMIWAAAALGLPIVDLEGSELNVLIGVLEREHDYVRRMVERGRIRPKAHHHRPAGYAYLRTALARAAAGEWITAGWTRRAPAAVSAPFHDWLIRQAGRDDVIGDLADDYTAGVRDSDHRVARTPDEMLGIFYEVSHSPEAYDAVVSAIAEWMMTVPTAKPVRTPRIGESVQDHSGWGAGAGTVERYEYRCPCGDGAIVEEHDNIPGFRDRDVSILCAKCSAEWRFAGGRSLSGWGLEPVSVTR
ncbi:hypothetical protein AB0C07_09850 [Actinoplanes missouriensis]|uniref:hypothetical protein n=1 Tax=Actinoplanes missouriensis TaxID=1866 RepID=UPI0033D3B012